MKDSTIEFFNNRMSAVVQYAFDIWKGSAADESSCYWVCSEYTEVNEPNRVEQGKETTSVILRGYTRGTKTMLNMESERIKKSVPCTTVLDDGTGIAIMYDYGMIVPTGDADLKSMKINMTIQERRNDL
jgi:hypothetical protein